MRRKNAWNHVARSRLARIIEMAGFIASHPGQARASLAQRYSLSERQVQADMHVLTDPQLLGGDVQALVSLRPRRHGGYRYELAGILRLWVNGEQVDLPDAPPCPPLVRADVLTHEVGRLRAVMRVVANLAFGPGCRWCLVRRQRLDQALSAGATMEEGVA